MRLYAILVALSIGGVALAALAPSASATPTCTGYMNVLGSKQRTCVDPAGGTSCPAWTDSYSMIGYYRSCYGTRALCNPYGCLATDLCNDVFCLA